MKSSPLKTIKTRFLSSQISSVSLALILLLLAVSILNGARFWKISNLITVTTNAGETARGDWAGKLKVIL